MPSHGRRYYPEVDYRIHDPETAHAIAVRFKSIFEFRCNLVRNYTRLFRKMATIFPNP